MVRSPCGPSTSTRPPSCWTGAVTLGRPPDDLPEVIALLGVSRAQAVVAARSLARAVGGVGAVDGSELRDAAGPVAWAFRNLFNLPETMAVVRGQDSPGALLAARPRVLRRGRPPGRPR